MEDVLSTPVALKNLPYVAQHFKESDWKTKKKPVKNWFSNLRLATSKPSTVNSRDVAVVISQQTKGMLNKFVLS